MSLLDVMYYGVYRFMRRLGHKPYMAEIWAYMWIPLVFITLATWVYAAITALLDSKMLPHTEAELFLVIATLLSWVCTYRLYQSSGRGKRIIAEYDKRNTRLYLWLGGLFTAIPILTPIVAILLLRAIL